MTIVAHLGTRLAPYGCTGMRADGDPLPDERTLRVGWIAADVAVWFMRAVYVLVSIVYWYVL